MNLPLLLAADISHLTEGSFVSMSLAYSVGGAVVVLAVGLAETRFRSASHEKALAKHEERFEKMDKAHEAAMEALRSKQQLMELQQAEGKVLMSEVRSQLAQQAEQGREQTRMLHELLSITSGTARRRSSDAA